MADTSMSHTAKLKRRTELVFDLCFFLLRITKTRALPKDPISAIRIMRTSWNCARLLIIDDCGSGAVVVVEAAVVAMVVDVISFVELMLLVKAPIMPC